MLQWIQPNIAFFSKISITYFTFEWFIFFMKSFNVSLHVMFRCEVSFANVTFEGLLPFMNCCNMFFQTLLWFKVYITNFTFALLFSYLYCTKICLFKLLLHLKSLLQISHMYFFILSWTDASWNSKAVFPPKLAIYPSMMWEWSTGHI